MGPTSVNLARIQWYSYTTSFITLPSQFSNFFYKIQPKTMLSKSLTHLCFFALLKQNPQNFRFQILVFSFSSLKEESNLSFSSLHKSLEREKATVFSATEYSLVFSPLSLTITNSSFSLLPTDYYCFFRVLTIFSFYFWVLNCLQDLIFQFAFTIKLSS